MKVTVENFTYFVHWETRKFNPITGNNTEKELDATDCVIKRVVGDNRYTPVEISRGHVSQTVFDQSNSVKARRLAFLKAIKDMPRSIRKPIGDEFNRTCRVVPRTLGQKNRKLRKHIAELQARINKLETSTEKVIA